MKMLEIGRTYPKPELSALFGSKDKEGLERKMTRYGIVFSSTGWAESRIYTIQDLTNPFKVFAITELGFDGNTDFTKLRNFYYHFFEDDIFMVWPDEVKEAKMREMGQPVSRQTIAVYTYRLEANGLINRYTKNYFYYFAHKQEQRITDREE